MLWPLFLYFIKEEELEYRNLYIDLEKDGIQKKFIQKNNKINLFKENKKIEKEKIRQNINLQKNIEKKRLYWFKWIENSCR